MFITVSKSGFNKDDEQFTHGYFLMIFQDPKGDTTTYTNEKDGSVRPVPELRALVRFVRMSPLGNWMMARVKVKDTTISLSGGYGSDGLPINLHGGVGQKGQAIYLPDQIHLWDSLHVIPKSLQNEFWNGGGHNCVGKEALNFRKWALDNLTVLKTLVKRKP
jgi:hypothetical protein